MPEFTMLASGYRAIEGPTVGHDGSLYFSDVYGGGVYRLAGPGVIETVVPRRKFVGGICLHASGGIVIAGRDVNHVRNGASEILLRPGDVTGGPGPVSGFNDLGADRFGRIFVGTTRLNPDGTLHGGDLVMIDRRGQAEVIYSGIGMPNGVATSPDGKLLYHADTERKLITVIDLADGVARPEVAGQLSTVGLPGGPDGMAIDEDSGIWTALYQGGAVARLMPDGQIDRQMDVPAANPLSVCFGGPGLTNLIIVTMDNSRQPELGGCILSVDAGVRGARVGEATL